MTNPIMTEAQAREEAARILDAYMDHEEAREARSGSQAAWYLAVIDHIRNNLAPLSAIEERDATIAELEANINLKADFIDKTLNQLAAKDQDIAERDATIIRLTDVRDHALALVNAYDDPDGPAFVKLNELRAALLRATLNEGQTP